MSRITMSRSTAEPDLQLLAHFNFDLSVVGAVDRLAYFNLDLSAVGRLAHFKPTIKKKEEL